MNIQTDRALIPVGSSTVGDLVSAQALTVVIAVRCGPRAEGGKAAVTLRLTDRDAALFPQPMVVDWHATDEATNAAQPVNNDVLIEVGQLVTALASGAALDANRRGDFKEATAIMQAAAANLRALAPGVRQVEALAAELEAELRDFGVVMSPRAMKALHFSTHSLSRSRDGKGKARKKDGGARSSDLASPSLRSST